MKFTIERMLVLLCLAFLLSGCAGVRNSYESLLDVHRENPVIVLKVGDIKEILSVGDGFPGWWGYYPGIASHDPAVASISCKRGRGLLPFREPGVIFGGITCHIEARKVGIAWLLEGNDLLSHRAIEEAHIPTSTTETRFPPKSPYGGRWIMVRVE